MVQYQNFMLELCSEEVERKKGFQSNWRSHYNYMVLRPSPPPPRLGFPTRPNFECFFNPADPEASFVKEGAEYTTGHIAFFCCFLVSSTRGDKFSLFNDRVKSTQCITI